MKANYKMGQKVKMSEDALANYGEHYRNQKFTIEHIAKNTTQHPGFDENGGSPLYDFKELNFSLYEWEMTI